jgi:hypothetical protein
MPGNLVQTAYEVRTLSSPEIDGSGEVPPNYLPPGTVGIIIKRPDLDRPRQFLVQFVGGHEWWMYTSEIEPYREEKKNV